MIEKNTVLLDLEEFMRLKQIEQKYFDLKGSIVYYDKNDKELSSLQISISGAVPIAVGISREKIEELFEHHMTIDKIRFYG